MYYAGKTKNLCNEKRLKSVGHPDKYFTSYLTENTELKTEQFAYTFTKWTLVSMKIINILPILNGLSAMVRGKPTNYVRYLPFPVV